ncbi:MAG: hypothetical protein WC632_04445 [Candidatus Margulisiibacteriota bacterium]
MAIVAGIIFIVIFNILLFVAAYYIALAVTILILKAANKLRGIKLWALFWPE